jgi:hypothetical protein
MIKKYIRRENYGEKIRPFIDQDVIKVITGQRRVGKSYLMLQIMDDIKKKHANANIIYINKELHQFEYITDHKELLAYIKANSAGRGRNYLFIDEIQDVDRFEKALRSLQAEGKYDIYCTGSNANLLSGELATTLGGRYIEIPVFGLSYREFLVFHKLYDDEETFLKYIKYGGLPYLIHLELSDQIVYDYLKSVYNSILLKDVVARHQIRNVHFLENLIEFLADNTGSLVSANKISEFLKSQKINMSPNIALNYLSFLQEAFFVYKVKRADIAGKKIFESSYKYYFEDLGLRHSIIGYRQADIGKALENLIFSYLKMSDYSVTVGNLQGKEIDFVAVKNGKKVYIQASYLITDENREREFGNLLAIQDNYPKYVISMDKMIGESDYRGIKQISIRELLTGKTII